MCGKPGCTRLLGSVVCDGRTLGKRWAVEGVVNVWSLWDGYGLGEGLEGCLGRVVCLLGSVSRK